jgi:hypothetical protein
LVNRGLHKVDADTLARAVALALDEGAMPLEIGAELLYGLQRFPCRAITRVGHHVQVLLEVGELIDKQVHSKSSGPEKTMID